MIKRLLLAVAMLCAVTEAQVPVTPATIPHVTFVNASGGPCAGCKLQTFTAGTTTPFPTYTDSSGGPVNQNPIILDAAGGANIWVGRHSYKFILKDTLGLEIWTVDNVNAATLFPCGPANTIQISNSGVSGLNCDANIFIDPINHTLNVGVISVNHVTIGALTTPTSWTFDTTTPATACASIGCALANPGTINQLAFYAAAGNTLSGTSAIPAGITATTQTPSDNTTKVATTAYVALPGIINPTSVQVASGIAMVGNQGNGTLVQHSTGATTTNNLAKFDANGNVVDSGTPASSTKIAQDLIVTSLCITGTAASATCTTGTATWPIAFADTSYTAVCTPGPVTSGLQGNVYVSNKTTTGFQLIIQNGQNSAAMATTFSEVDCHGSHI